MYFEKVWRLAAILVLLSSSRAGADTAVGTTADQKALGYTDARKLARSSTGKLYLAYRAKDPSNVYEIYVKVSSDDGANWTTMNGGNPISSNSDGEHQRVPAIAIDSSDNLHVVWYGKDVTTPGANQRIIKYRRFTGSTQGWQPQKIIGSPSGYAAQNEWQEHPIIYVSSNDHLYVVWEGRDGTYGAHPQARYNVSTDGGSTWMSSTGSFVKPCNGTGGCPNNQSRVTVVVDGSEKMFVLAYGYWSPSGRQNIIYSTNESGSFSAWTAAVPETLDQRHPSAAIDSGGKIHLVWRSKDDPDSPTYSVIRYSKYTPGSGFNTPVTISPTTTQFQLFPSIANYNGQQHVVWTQTTAADPGLATEEPTLGKIVYAHKCGSTCAWATSDVTTFANNVWGSIRWSFDVMNGGNIDIVYGSGASSPFTVMFHSRGVWP